MTELEKYDLNGDGVLDAEERKLMCLKIVVAVLRMTINNVTKFGSWFGTRWQECYSIRLGYFFVIFLALVMPLLFLAISLVLILLQFLALVASFFGASAYQTKKKGD